MPVVLVKRATFFFKGAAMVAIEVSSGDIEIYRIEDGGLEIFQGYIDSLNIPGALRMRACNALYSDGSDHVTFSRPLQLELGLEVC